MKQLKIISEKCIACGKCYLNFPEVFDCTDDGIAFIKENSSPSQHANSERAIFDCPTRAITLSDSTDDGNLDNQSDDAQSSAKFFQ